MKRIVLVALAATLLGSGVSASEETRPQATSAGSHFKLAIITSDKYSQDEKGVFAPDAPKVFAVYRVIAGPGLKVRASWFAEKVAGLEPKTKLAENETAFSTKGEYIGSFTCSKPPQGWPVGSYSVNLYMDGVLKKTLGFRVEKQ
jgi:opacity protein-like surface antigen